MNNNKKGRTTGSIQRHQKKMLKKKKGNVLFQAAKFYSETDFVFANNVLSAGSLWEL